MNKHDPNLFETARKRINKVTRVLYLIALSGFLPFAFGVSAVFEFAFYDVFSLEVAEWIMIIGLIVTVLPLGFSIFFRAHARKGKRLMKRFNVDEFALRRFEQACVGEPIARFQFGGITQEHIFLDNYAAVLPLSEIAYVEDRIFNNNTTRRGAPLFSYHVIITFSNGRKIDWSFLCEEEIDLALMYLQERCPNAMTGRG